MQKFIMSYNWNKIKENLKMFDILAEEKDINSIIIDKVPSPPDENNPDSSKALLICENMYSSYSRWWECQPKTDKEKVYFKYKIMEKHQSIIYLISNAHLESVDSKTIEVN